MAEASEPKVFSGFELVEDEEVKLHVNEHGVSGIDRLLQKKLETWKQIPLNVAITGAAGAGKSSFINAVFKLSGDDIDKGAAPVGVVETTQECLPYPHPDNDQLIFWDLPGVGTKKFPQKSYLDDVNFRKYDFFLILSSVRFTQYDLWLAKEVRSQQKRFLFVRTKIDMDMFSDERAHPQTHDKTEVIQKIKTNCIEHFPAEERPGVNVFVISNFRTHEWDFPALTLKLIIDLPGLKRDAMALSLNLLTTDVVKEKKKALADRIFMIAALSAVGGLTPIPGLSFGIDMGLICNESRFYRLQFGLDDKSIENLANQCGIAPKNLLQIAKLKTMSTFYSKEGLSGLFVKYGTLTCIGEASHFIPIIGSGIGGALSYVTTTKVLKEILDTLEENALAILSCAFQTTSRV